MDPRQGFINTLLGLTQAAQNNPMVQGIENGVSNVGKAVNAVTNPISALTDTIQNIAAPSPADIVNTATKNHFTPGQLVNNAKNDIGGMASGFAAMPGQIAQGVTHPQQGIQMLGNTIGSAAKSMNDTFGDPINPQTFMPQLPNKEQMVQNAFNHPIQTLANLSPALEAGKAGGVAEAADTARPPLAPPGWQSEGMKAQAVAGKTIGELQQMHQDPELTAYENARNSGDMARVAEIAKNHPGDARFQVKTAADVPGSMRLVPKSQADIQATQVPPVAQNVKDTFLKQFTVPAKVADKINMDKAAQTVISDGIAPDFKSLDAARNVITGGSGELPKMIYRALGDVTDPVDVSQIMQDGYDRIKSVPELADTPGKLQAFQDIMKNLFPAGTGGKVDAMDAWDAMQQLERRGYAYSAKSHYLTNNPYYEDLGKSFTDTANDMQDALESKLKGVNLNQYITPEMRQNLGSVSPKILQRFDAMPKTIDNIRAFQKPYVDLGTMMRQTNAASHTAFSNASAMAAKAIGVGGGGAVGSAFGPVGTGAGAFIGGMASPVLEPLIKGAIDKYGPGLQLAGAKAISNIGKNGLPSLGGVKTAAGVAPIIADATKSSQQPTPTVAAIPGKQATTPNPPGVIANNTAPMKYSDIPQDVTQLKPNAQGQYVITSPQNITDKNGQPIAMSEQDYASQKAQLQQQLGTLPVKYNPRLSSQLESQLQQLETTHNLSSQAQAGYSGAMKASNAVTSTLQTLADAPVNLFNKNQTIQKLNSEFNGKYATLAQQLQILQKYYPVMIDSVMKAPSTDYAKQILSQISNQVAQDYYQGINGLTGNVPGQEATQQAPIPTQQPGQNSLPSLGGSSINNGNGGSVHGHALASF